MSKKMMMAVIALLPSLGLFPVRAQQPVVIDLETALEIALSENPTVKVADAEIEKKQYARKGAYAALFPQIDFSADYNRTLKKQVMYMDFDTSGLGIDDSQTIDPEEDPETGTSSDGFQMGRLNNWSMGFSASIPVVNAQLWKSLTITGLDVDLAIEQARSSKIEMVNQVKKAYFAVLLAKDSYDVFTESYNNAMENYLDVKKKFDQGQVAEYDLIRADVSVKNAEPNVLQAENALVLAKWQLKALMAVDLDLDIEIRDDLSNYKVDLFNDFLNTNTDLTDNTTLRQIDIQANQLKETRLMQKYEYFPTLSLGGAYQWIASNNDFRFRNYDWNPYSYIGVSLSVPIFSGGRKLNAMKQTKVSINQLQWQREDTERNLELSAKLQMDNMSNSIKRFEAAQKGVEQAERGHMIAQKRYETGLGTLLELNDAELALTQTRLNYNQAIYDYIVAKADLERVVGNQDF